MGKEGSKNKLLGSAIKTRPKLFRNSEHGMTLIEVLVALAILGAVAAVFLFGLMTSSKAVMISQNRVVAESLGKSQIEYTKSQDYDNVHNPPQYVKVGNIPAGYDIIITATRLDPNGDGTGNDDGLQEIAVTVNRNGETAYTVVNYMVNR
jgi:prepilin-type N-terminal cleavage/methylation domain-containing protein